jgi:hypothetical protein
MIGNPGTGKTTTLIDKALTDIEHGEGVLFVDLTGTAVDTILRHIPQHRTNDVLCIDPQGHPVGWNILSEVIPKDRPLYATLIRDTIKALSNYTTATPVMDRMIFNTIGALLECPFATLLDIEPMLTDKAFRTSVLKHVSDEYLLRKWRYWETKNARDYDTLIASTENKAGEFSEDPRIRAILGKASTFNLKQMLFERKVILLRLPQGVLGTARASMFASLFLAHVQAIVYARTIHMPLNIYIDDFHNLDTPILRSFLSNGGRYGVSLTLANQFLAQLSKELRSSVIGNCARRIMFQTGIEDSEYLHRTIPKDNVKMELHELDRYETLTFHGELTQGHGSKPRGKGSTKRQKTVLTQSHRQYGDTSATLP